MGPKRERSLSRSGQSLYGVLGVEKGASAAQIRAAYRRQALRHHPDKNAGSAAAAERFKELNAAHAVLSDPRRRRLYDRYGSEGLRVAADFGEENVPLYFALASPCARAALLLCGLLTGCWCGCCFCCGCCCGCCCRCCGAWKPAPPAPPPAPPAPSPQELEAEDGPAVSQPRRDPGPYGSDYGPGQDPRAQGRDPHPYGSDYGSAQDPRAHDQDTHPYGSDYGSDHDPQPYASGQDPHLYGYDHDPHLYGYDYGYYAYHGYPDPGDSD
ncbi:dnaJ homolog subfamily C member 5-like [Tiliqua scincoides]|uniref:dnaJ homolog subfamily C member 5-like n=1 Tax=Tiliqua scincoides TaxID=71010 RepID=UPI003461C013